MMNYESIYWIQIQIPILEIMMLPILLLQGSTRSMDLARAKR
jgi:hypothetical protein